MVASFRFEEGVRQVFRRVIDALEKYLLRKLKECDEFTYNTNPVDTRGVC